VNQGKTPAASAVTLSMVIMQDMTNPFGTAHGGEMLKLMDNTAGCCAVKHSGGRVTTRAISEVEFTAPIRQGNLVHCQARVTYVSKHTMEVKVEITAENLWRQIYTPSVKAYFVYVLLNDDASQMLEVPPLLPETDEEWAEFTAGRLRMEAARNKQQNAT